MVVPSCASRVIRNMYVIRRLCRLAICATSTVEPSIPDTLGTERTVLIKQMSLFQGLNLFYIKCIVKTLVQVTCVRNIGMSILQEAGIEGSIVPTKI